MGHARRMMNNRRRLIWEMTKEKEKDNERRRNDHDQGIHDVGEHERILERQGSLSRN